MNGYIVVKRLPDLPYRALHNFKTFELPGTALEQRVRKSSRQFSLCSCHLGSGLNVCNSRQVFFFRSGIHSKTKTRISAGACNKDGNTITRHLYSNISTTLTANG